MIEEHVDPTAEAHAHISNLVRSVVTAAAGVAERRAQRRAEEAREAQRLAEAECREIEQRIAGQRQAAELVYRRAYRDTWWERANEGDIAGVVIAAGTWAASDPRADDALSQVSERLAERYGLDMDLHALCRGETGPAGAADTVRQHVASITAKAQVPAFGVVVMDAAGPTLGAALIASEGWLRLAHRLETMAAAGGVDVPGRLRAAIASRELDTAADKALALSWRLKSAPDHDATTRGATRAARRGAHEVSPSGKAAPMSATARLARQRATGRPRQSGPERAGGSEAGR